MNWADFFHMGGYALYVWSSWAVTAVVIVYLYSRAKISGAKIRREITRQIEREKLQQQFL